MLNDFSRLKSLPPYYLGSIARKVNELRVQGKEVIDLSQINPDLPPPQKAIDLLIQSSLQLHNHKYSSSIGISSLRSAIANYYNVRFNVEVDSDSEIVLTSGTKEGLFHLLLSTLAPGDTVLVPVPSYPLHTSSVCLADGSFIGIPLWKTFEDMITYNSCITSSYDFFFEELEKNYSRTWPRPKILLLSFPHNPTTTIASICFFERLIEFARLNNILIVNDFAHGDLYHEKNECVSLLSVKGASDTSVELYSLSKGYSLPGWRIGALVGNSTYVQALKKIKSYIDFGIFQPIQIAASKLLLDECKNEYSASIASENASSYSSRKDIIIDGLNRLGWTVAKSKASPFIWASLPKKFDNFSSEQFCEKLLIETLIASSPGKGFLETDDTLVRFSLGQSESMLNEAIFRIEKFQSSF